MAPLLSFFAFALFALFSTTAASPHIARHVLDHRQNNPIVPRVHLDDADTPLRRRSLNRRCVPSNSTTSPIPSATSPIPSYLPTNSSSTLSSTSSTSPPPTTSSTPSSTPPPPTTSSAPPPPTTSSAPETTSAAPTTTSSPPPPTTSSPSPTTTTSPPPAQTSSASTYSGEPSYLTSTNSGQGTWFEVGLGACGHTNNDSQFIVAISEDIFDNFPNYSGGDPNTNPVCGMSITISYGGASVDVTVVDRCVGCKELDLDLSPSAFSVLAATSVGRINMTWKFT